MVARWHIIEAPRPPVVLPRLGRQLAHEGEVARLVPPRWGFAAPVSGGVCEPRGRSEVRGRRGIVPAAFDPAVAQRGMFGMRVILCHSGTRPEK
jgi:hypothetical protein